MNSDIKISFSTEAIKKSFLTFIRRFHVVIFVIVVLGGLAIIIFLLNTVVVTSSQANGYTPDINNSTFDQATIKKIENLQTTGQSNQLALPPGRTNPFVE